MPVRRWFSRSGMATAKLGLAGMVYMKLAITRTVQSMKARIHLHSFEALAFDRLVPASAGSASANGCGPDSALVKGERFYTSGRPRCVVSVWMAAADTAHPPDDSKASAIPLIDL